MKRPNLFYHATKELSQDAFLCYVFSYFNEEYKNSYPKEYEFSKFFIKDIFKSSLTLYIIIPQAIATFKDSAVP